MELTFHVVAGFIWLICAVLSGRSSKIGSTTWTQMFLVIANIWLAAGVGK